MTRYRKKPVEVEAVQICSENGDRTAWPEWLVDAFSNWQVTYHGVDKKLFWVASLEGGVCGEIGDWIVRGVEGELYPVKDSIFRKTYEEVT